MCYDMGHYFHVHALIIEKTASFYFSFLAERIVHFPLTSQWKICQFFCLNTGGILEDTVKTRPGVSKGATQDLFSESMAYKAIAEPPSPSLLRFGFLYLVKTSTSSTHTVFVLLII